MNPYGDSAFRQLYLNRLLRALGGFNTPNSSGKQGQKDEVPCSGTTIKLAADVSLAMTANRPAWSHALMNKISDDQKNRPLLRRMLGPMTFQSLMAQRVRYQSRLILQSKLKRAHMKQHKALGGFGRYSLQLCRIFCFNRNYRVRSSSYARLVRRRTKKLQNLVPGGKSMETSCFLSETADYIAALKTQVDVLQALLTNIHNEDSSTSMVET